MKTHPRLFFACVAALSCLLHAGQVDPRFTRSPLEHIIHRIDQPFVVRSIRGMVNRSAGDKGPLPAVLFEILGPDQRIRRVKTQPDGQFKISRVPDGTYQFKATLNGFQSVMGTIVVSSKAPKQNLVKIAMPIGL